MVGRDGGGADVGTRGAVANGGVGCCAGGGGLGYLLQSLALLAISSLYSLYRLWGCTDEKAPRKRNVVRF